jgi:predicted membrane protein
MFFSVFLLVFFSSNLEIIFCLVFIFVKEQQKERKKKVMLKISRKIQDIANRCESFDFDTLFFVRKSHNVGEKREKKKVNNE